MVRPGPPGPDMPNIEGLGAPCVADWEKLRGVEEGEEELGSLWVVRLRAAVDASTRVECAGAGRAATPCRMAGARTLCMESIDIVTGASSAAEPLCGGRVDINAVGCWCAELELMLIASRRRRAYTSAPTVRQPGLCLCVQ